MEKNLEKTLLMGSCLLVVAVALATAGWVVASGQFLYMDGLLLTFVCLLVAAIFGGEVAYEIRDKLRALLFSGERSGKGQAKVGSPGAPGRSSAGSGPKVEAGQGGKVVVTSEHEHAGGTRLYLAVWGWLLGITVLEVILAFQHLPLEAMLMMLMGLSVVKAALIMAYFMHLRFERLNLVLTVVPALVLVISLFAMFFPDSFRILKLGIG